ncbi:single-stranded-DNA-specific exonuclease RecJ [Candidatus Shapirobacteria bacterium CG09_land_8_20_14_0_10_38_17]|uniref:Single-stranded-DNA-specific exonuclease RecJ n=1 Tax=Candidatus Shapirobacteria bacterium CG09_land_8_20_14_0_10_38_17 TaxID=1974884 RepID=A0A2H0WQK8_9BACT|nr:MAG: single-stranded-DNA-specific exonuclease RecJ [Candidatus Shapirobacteria bacterium CG09_land_8_20_14_0_10_38_17]
MKQWQVLHKARGKSLTQRRQEIIEAILKNRKIKERKEFFEPSSPLKIGPADLGISLKELAKAKKRLLLAKKRGEQILIWGDYDADGICGTAVLWEALWENGFDVLPHIPKRSEGYGLNEKVFSKIKKKHPNIGLVITVDNGIVSYDRVEEIAKLGVEFIVTDHHIKEEKMPKAVAIIWSKKVCGAAVAWFLAREFTRPKGNGLELVALATVADFMPLLSINRSLVRYGLRCLRQTKRIGLLALYKEAGLVKENLEAYHIGFIIAPRLNAMGRLAEAMDSLRLLCTKDRARARQLAQKIGKANRERQAKMNKVFLGAVERIRQDGKEENKLLFVHSPSFHSGVIGLVAGKLVEKFHRPAVVAGEEGAFTKASCRSIKGFNIIMAIRRLDKYLIAAGGHPQAAGFTVKTKDLPAVEEELQNIAEKEINKKSLIPKLEIDCQLNFADLNFSLFREIERFEPFGFGNSRPIFKTANVIIKGVRQVGNSNNHLKFILDDPATEKIENIEAEEVNSVLNGIGFGMGNLDLRVDDRIDIAYSLVVDEWNGRKNLELRVEEIRKISNF